MASIIGHEKYTESICWHCENCAKCNWGRYDKKKCKVNFGVVRGWKVKHERGGITVLDCPQYIPDARYEESLIDKSGIPAEARAALNARRDELRGLSKSVRAKAVRRIYKDAGFCQCGRNRLDGKKTCEKCYESRILKTRRKLMEANNETD